MIYKKDNWGVGHYSQDGLPMVVRARTSLPLEADRELFSHLIIIKWPYTSDTTGMPEASDKIRIKLFEDTLESILDAPCIGVQALSLTGNGMREWRYYTQDPTKFMEALNQNLQGQEPYPIDLQLFQDKEWTALAEIIGV